MPEYRGLTDDEVLQIATEREQLTDDARSMLDSELARRKLSIKDVQSQKIAYERAEKLERARLGHRILNQRTFSRPGFGINFLGKTNVRLDPAGHFEEYDATQWVVIFWILVFPSQHALSTELALDGWDSPLNQIPKSSRDTRATGSRSC